jgi:hypothetical protein
MPARDQAPSTNVITVLAIDDGEPPQTATNTFRVIVSDFLEVSLGSTVLRAGQTGSVPVSVLTSSGVTNLSALLFAPSDRLANLGLTTLAPELRPASLEAQGPNLLKMTFNTMSGQVLQDGRLLAQLNFTAVSNHSAFVPLVLSNVTAMRASGVSVPRTLAGDGRVVVVSEEPLLQALSATNLFPALILYGEPAANYIIEATPDLQNSNQWQTVWTGSLTNLFQMVMPASSTNYNRFLRAIRP